MDGITQTVFDGRIEHNKKSELEKLQDTTNASNRILFRAKTVFPFDFFPDEIVIEENKIDIIYGLFFMSRKVVSIPIVAINNANAASSAFFGALSIEMVGPNENPHPVDHLWTHDAMRARRFINGLIICHHQKIDLSKLEIQFVKKKIEEIGSI